MSDSLNLKAGEICKRGTRDETHGALGKRNSGYSCNNGITVVAVTSPSGKGGTYEQNNNSRGGEEHVFDV
jgi:hypothetical protein